MSLLVTLTISDYAPDGAAGRMDLAAAAWAARLSQIHSCWPVGAAGGRAQTDTAVNGLHDHATCATSAGGERADASVRCTGLGANLCAVAEQRHRPVTFADSWAHVSFAS